jgi:hypothetical protein
LHVRFLRFRCSALSDACAVQVQEALLDAHAARGGGGVDAARLQRSSVVRRDAAGVLVSQAGAASSPHSGALGRVAARSEALRAEAVARRRAKREGGMVLPLVQASAAAAAGDDAGAAPSGAQRRQLRRTLRETRADAEATRVY